MAAKPTYYLQLTPQAQLPPAWYVDPNIYTLEELHLFPQTSHYLGHALMVPNIGDYHVLDWTGNAKSLIHQQDGISAMSNVCRHRQAIMLKGRGHTKNIACPLHRWTYDLEGKLLGAPHFDKNPCLHLQQKSLQNWQGLLFDSKRNIAQDLVNVGCKHDFNFTDYVLDRVMVEEYNFNWKTFIEVYLEDYHVGPFHPGLNQFVDCNALNWEFGAEYSLQKVGFKQSLTKSGSPVYQQWQQQVAKYHAGNTPKYGAIWMVYYPFLMIEWYPDVLVVSHIIPRGVDACSNVVEFYYPEDIVLFEREYASAQQTAYNETAEEDNEICQRMHVGRRALFAQGIDERGPYQHPMESGLEHFHIWYRNQLEQYLG